MVKFNMFGLEYSFYKFNIYIIYYINIILYKIYAV